MQNSETRKLALAWVGGLMGLGCVQFLMLGSTLALLGLVAGSWIGLPGMRASGQATAALLVGGATFLLWFGHFRVFLKQSVRPAEAPHSGYALWATFLIPIPHVGVLAWAVWVVCF